MPGWQAAGQTGDLTADQTVLLMEHIRRLAARTLAKVDHIRRSPACGKERPQPMRRDDLARALAGGSVILLDLRPEDEFAAAHLPEAIHGRRDDLAAVAARLAGNQIIAYCRNASGARGHQAFGISAGPAAALLAG